MARTKEPKERQKEPRLTDRERKLADLSMAGVTGRDAAKLVYNPANDNSAAAIASEVLARPNVRQYLEDAALGAAERVNHLSGHARSEMVSLIASKDILDRTGFKTPEPARDDRPGATYNFLFSAETREEVKAIEDSIKRRLLAPPAEHHVP